MKKRIIAMVLSVAMMLTMFPTGVLAEDFDLVESTESITETAEGQSNQGEESDTTQVNVVENEETQLDTKKPENEQTEPGQTENDQTEPTQNETDQAAPGQTETNQTEQTEPGSTVPDQAGTQPGDKQPTPEQPATDPAENGVSDGAENTEGEQAESKTEFTVTWKNGETVLAKAKFAEGTSAEEVENAQPAETPVQEADDEFVYIFSGWDHPYEAVTADQTYEAKFTKAKKFTVTWVSEGETILTKTFAEGTSAEEVENAQPAEAPVKEADGDVEYTFAGWTPDYADVTADQTYTAKFEEPAAENSGSKWDALKNSIGNWFGGAVQPFSIQRPDNFKVDTYKFFVGEKEQTDWTQRVAAGDELKIPGTPQKDGYVFEGWFAGDTEVKGGEITKVSGAEVIVNARFKPASCYVYFMDKDGNTVMHTAQGAKDDTVQPEDISTAEAKVRPTLKGNQSVQGWSTTKDGDPLENIAFTEGTRTLFPVVKDGYWVTFNSDGGSYIAPKFIIEGKQLNLSEIEPPTRAGYDFIGWYNQDGEQVDTVSVEATVKAHWQPQSDVEYTVIYWQENADDTGYSFAKSETKKGKAGEPAKAGELNENGFTLNEKKTEQKNIAGDGSTILNVYYKREVYKVRFYDKWGNTEYTKLCITDKYGANISKKWPKKNGSSTTWRTESGAYQANIDTMPLEGAKFYGPKTGSFSETASYYLEVGPNETPDETSNGIGYKLDHKDTTPGSILGLTVTKEDQYSITGFDFVKEISTDIGKDYDGAKFYYNRQKYDIKFINNGNVEETKPFKYQYPIDGAYYEPKRPEHVDKNFKFDGWYENAQCSGNAYVFEGKTMPAKSITLYAKWAAPQIKVTIEGIKDPIWVPYRSKLAESAEWNDLLTKLQPQPDAWMIDGKIFNPNTELYKDITLTPYYKTDATPYKITYDENGIKRDDPTRYAKGSTATIRNPENTQYSDGLKFQYWEMGDQQLRPGESIIVTGNVTLKAVYDKPPENLTLTYHNGDTSKSFTVPANSKQTAKDPAASDLGFNASEDKWFAGWTTKENGTVPEYGIGDPFYVSTQGNNDLYAVWKDKLQITVEAKSGEKTYDGKPLTVEGFKTLSFEVEGNTYTVEGLTARATGTNVSDSKAVEVTGTAKVLDAKNNDVTAQFNVKTVNGKLTIKPVAIELTANSAEKPYDGKALTANGYEITKGAFADKEGLESVTVEGSQTLAGSSDNKITAHALKANTKAENYSISYKPGKLTVTNRTNKYEITVEANSGSKTYDGSPLTVEGFKNLSFNVEGNTYTVSGLTARATGTNVSDSKAVEVTGAAKVLDAKNNDVTAQFNVKTVNGKLTIKPKEITVTADDKSKTYGADDPDLTATATGLVGKDTVDYTLNRKPGEDVGEYAITVTGDEVQGNYKVSFADGKLVITPKNIVPGDNNKDLTATAPADVVYSGKSQQQKPIVKDGDKVLEEGKDYTLTYSEDTTNAGIVTVTITGKGNYDSNSKFEVTYKITPAPLKITTNSAEKTYDGSALTAEGKIEGLVKGETATLKTTGSQTEVGESKNTYEIEWGTAKASNYEITEDIGTLTVNKRSSGGGSSSKPTPEEEPTPTPTPTPLPTLPTTPAPTTPARRVTRSTATVTEPASRPTEQITENETPKAESEPEVIEDEETPLAPMATGAWALVNLILMLLTVLASLLLLLGYLGKKKYAKEDEYGNALHDANGNEIIDYTRNKKGFWRVASLIPAIAAVIAFALTENMRLPMVMTDRWTLLMVIIAVVQLIVAVLCKKKKESEEDENQANA